MWYCNVILVCENVSVCVHEIGYDDPILAFESGTDFFSRHPDLVPYLKIEISFKPD